MARCIAVLRQRPSSRALAQQAAALVHGFACAEQEPDIHVVTAGHARSGPRRLPRVAYGPTGRRGAAVSIVPREIHLPSEEITTVNGLPVMTPERTILDCALTLPVRQSICVIDSAMRSLCRPDRHRRVCEGADPGALTALLLSRLEELGPQRGIRRARAAIALGSPWSESPGESVLRWVIHAAGLPRPTLQEPWYDAAEDSAYAIDLAWSQLHVAIEFDGYSKYSAQEDLRREKHREMRLQAGGWTVLRFDWTDLAHPERVIQRLQAALPPGAAASQDRPRDLWA